jgi:Secretion system C-terminal sorting domain
LSWDVFDPNSLSWNQLDNNFFRNFGLNACDCTTDVSSINCATMLSDNFVLNAGSWFPVSLRNPAPGGCPLAYHDESVNINTAFGNLIECNDPSCFLPLQPLAEEWYDPIDPNQVTETDLRPQPGDPDPYIIAPTYPLCNNGELVSRKSRLNFQKELSFHPNPTSDFLIIENVEPGQTISICNITGEILMETIITSSASQIDIKKFPSGVYILKSQNTKTYKFIKL